MSQKSSMSRRWLVRAGLGLSAISGLQIAGTLERGDTVVAGVTARQETRRTLTLATNRVPSDLDPHSAYDAGSGVILAGPFEGLLRLKAGTTDDYVPLLAESWSANADASVWTFRLRKGVTFQDGTPFDADAAHASFARLLALDLAPSQVLGRFLTDPAQITLPDPHTLVFDLGRPQPLFEAAMASPYGTAIVNVSTLQQHEVNGDWGHAWAQTHSDGVGTGPYAIITFDLEDGVRMERYNGYWGGWQDDQFERIILRIVVEPETRRQLLEHGDADIAATLPLGSIPELEQNPDLVVDHRYNLAVQYLAMTVAGPLTTPEARQALCWAFPYEDVINGVYEGFARQAVGPLAELGRGFDPQTFVYHTDLARARELLDTAGVAAGTTLTLLLPAGNQDSAAIAELLQANLAQIGLQLEIQLIDFATYVGIATGDAPAEERPNLFPAFWSPDYNDGWNHLSPMLSCDGWQTGNLGHYCNPQVETLLDQARDAADATTYQAALSEIQQIVTRDDPAAIYVAQAEWLTVLRRDVTGFAPDLVTGGIINFNDLRRDEVNGA